MIQKYKDYKLRYHSIGLIINCNQFCSTVLCLIFTAFFTEEEKSDTEDEDEEDTGNKEVLKTAEIYHAGAVNRVRVRSNSPIDVA